MKIKLTILTLLTTFSFVAQKKELKNAQTSMILRKYGAVRKDLDKIRPKLNKMNGIDKSKYHLLTGQYFAYNSAKANLENYKKALKSFNTVLEIEKKIKRFPNSKKARTDKLYTLDRIEKNAIEAQNAKEHIKAMGLYKFIYDQNKKDTVQLYRAAANAVNGKKYDVALKHYNKLLEVGFTGIAPVYSATDVATGKIDVFENKKTMDKFIKEKKYAYPKVTLSKPLRGEITKNIALIYYSQGDSAKAEAAFAKAKADNPNDTYIGEVESQMLVQIASDYSKEGKNEEALKVYKKALKGSSSNNAGVINQNIASLILQKDIEYVNKLNSLTTSKSDKIIYKEYEEKRKNNFIEAAVYLENFLKIKPDNKVIAKSLYDIYTNVGNPKASQIKAKYGL